MGDSVQFVQQLTAGLICFSAGWMLFQRAETVGRRLLRGSVMFACLGVPALAASLLKSDLSARQILGGLAHLNACLMAAAAAAAVTLAMSTWWNLDRAEESRKTQRASITPPEPGDAIPSEHVT